MLIFHVWGFLMQKALNKSFLEKKLLNLEIGQFMRCGQAVFLSERDEWLRSISILDVKAGYPPRQIFMLVARRITLQTRMFAVKHCSCYVIFLEKTPPVTGISRLKDIIPLVRLSCPLQLFWTKRPEHFTCFLFIDVIICFNAVFQNFPLIINCCCFRTVFWWI